MKKYLILMTLFLAACNCTSFRRGDKVTVSIVGELKKCYCTVQYVKISQTVVLRCNDGGKYETNSSNLIKCGHEKDYDLE